ncbi:unnamed protein product [Lymnaea stagnalis]|uniref:Uncharacterized protein n=1 Tax=Lymnaea stagnalis TaxID=6523 RepID=A0AAV2H8H8_LYMST
MDPTVIGIPTIFGTHRDWEFHWNRDSSTKEDPSGGQYPMGKSVNQTWSPRTTSLIVKECLMSASTGGFGTPKQHLRSSSLDKKSRTKLVTSLWWCYWRDYADDCNNIFDKPELCHMEDHVKKFIKFYKKLCSQRFHNANQISS